MVRFLRHLQVTGDVRFAACLLYSTILEIKDKRAPQKRTLFFLPPHLDTRKSPSKLNQKTCAYVCATVPHDSRVKVRVLVVQPHDKADQDQVWLLVVHERASVGLRHRPGLERPPQRVLHKSFAKQRVDESKDTRTNHTHANRLRAQQPA